MPGENAMRKALVALSVLALYGCSHSRSPSVEGSAVPAEPSPADGVDRNAAVATSLPDPASPPPVTATAAAPRAYRPPAPGARAEHEAPMASAAPLSGSRGADLDALSGAIAKGVMVAPGAAGPAAAPPALAARPWQGAASVRAGEWDDNANYREFMRYLESEENLAYHKLDLRQRRFLVVTDAKGKPVPRCKLTVSDHAQHAVTLTTSAAGRAVLFPRAEGLVGNEVTVTANPVEGGSVTKQADLTESDGLVTLKLDAARALHGMRTIDVAFILDTTGSMGEEIGAVKATIQKVASGLGENQTRVRIGMVEYKDRGDAFVTRVYPMSTDISGFAARVQNLEAGGGGDMPESVNEGVHTALSSLDWSADSVGRYAFLVGDAPPHLDYAQDFDYAVEMRNAAHRGIQVFTVAASGMDDIGQVVWRQIAAYTDATDMFVLRGGAGPQSVGGGDPKSSCGGTHANYTSGNLDQLILAHISREVRALDGDPLRIAGLGQDEDAKPCEQRIARQ
jgi:uncharacterized protein YegL